MGIFFDIDPDGLIVDREEIACTNLRLSNVPFVLISLVHCPTNHGYVR